MYGRIGLMGLLVIAVASGCASGPESYDPEIGASMFSRSTVIDNPYFPMEPGTTFVYEGVNEEGTMETAEITITDDTRAVMGIDCRVVNHVEYVDGVLIEDTMDWYAQDNDGNVWYFGEDVKNYVDGEFDGTSGSWEAGVDGALPGIIMPADPVLDEEYYQEYYRGVAEDKGKNLRNDMTIEIGYGTFTDVLQVEEWNPLEPGVTGYKHYAPGTGLIYESERGSQERVELVEIRAAR